jgi:hypothetical protein
LIQIIVCLNGGKIANENEKLWSIKGSCNKNYSENGQQKKLVGGIIFITADLEDRSEL